jgi:hypothetical protein
MALELLTAVMNTKIISGQRLNCHSEAPNSSHFKWPQHKHTDAMPVELRDVLHSVAELRGSVTHSIVQPQERGNGLKRGGNLKKGGERRGEKGKEAVRRQSVRKGS